MADVVAQQKFACPACGAEATWNPAKQALVCGYCGTTSPAQLEMAPGGGEVIREHDLAQALRSIPDDQRGWKTERVQVLCQSCKAISVFDPARIAQRCDFCGSAALVPYTDVKEPFSPESLLAFLVSDTQVRDAVRQWYGRRWFAPNALGTRAMTDQLHGMYIPYWTFDARVEADWSAESGYYYYETEYYTDANGNRQSRQVQRVRWESSFGHVSHFFDDELVCASKGVDPGLIRGIEPFPTRDLVPYQAGFLAGWVVERYQIDLVAAAQHSRESMESKLHQLCARQVPGDTHRNLQVRGDWSGQTFKHILVPVWLLTYQYHAKTFHVIVNGYTGAIAGTYPKSWVKIFLTVLAIAAFVLLVVFFGKNA
ncbi:MAG: zinc ribbon domain-containing protein [Verrucomicrobiales bacterium]|nr:zinc ribbon domain-containing protein [Verrucomicrobiales bacterium]